MFYSYSGKFSEELQQSWSWSRTFSAAPEILSYAQEAARRFSVYEHVKFNTSVTDCEFDETAQTWNVKTDKGDHIQARFLIMANGPLSTPRFPHVQGLDDFEGTTLHTALWNDVPDLTGKRIGVIGTGSSGIQVIPELAQIASKLYVFQRSPAWCARKNDEELTPEYWDGANGLHQPG